MPPSTPSDIRTATNGIERGRWERVVLGTWAVAVAWTIWASLPPTVIVFTDDFGYLRSVVATLQHGRPWTDDWLEPWAASLSVLSAALFKCTGSFRLAVYGLQAGLAGVSAWWAVRLLRDRELPLPAAIGWSLVLLSVPTMLWKFSEFGAMPLYFASLLIAIRAAERGRWVLFGCAWFVALSSRQSALVWLVLPAGVMVERALAGRAPWGKTAAGIALLAAAGTLVFLGLRAGMNRTHAQIVMSPDLWENFAKPAFWKNALLGGGFFVVAVGVGAFVLRASFQAGPAQIPRKGRWPWVWAASTVVLGFGFADPRKLAEFEHPYWVEGPGRASLLFLLLLSLVGWWGRSFWVRRAHLITVVAFCLLLGLRGVLWEYYLLDVVVLGLLSVRPLGEPPRPTQPPRGWVFAGYTAMAGLVAMHATVATGIKQVLDRNGALVSLCEPALRTGLIAPAELSVAPFGYQGWQLYPHFVAHEGAGGGYIANFTNYLKSDALRLDIDGDGEPVHSVANGKLQSGETLLRSEIASWRWTERRRFNLIRRAGAAAAPGRLDPAHFPREYFPLSDEEWRQYIAGKVRNEESRPPARSH